MEVPRPLLRWGGGGDALELEMLGGVVGDGCRTVPFVFQSGSRTRSGSWLGLVVDGVGGFRLVIGDLPEPFPERCRVVG